MNLINDDQFYKLKIGTITALSSDNVPFLWCSHDDLGLFNLLFGEMNVTSQLSHSNPEIGESLLEIAHNLGN